MAMPAGSAISDRQWYIVGRWQEYEGEGRANLIRIVAIGVFYAIQLVHFYTFRNAEDAALREAEVFHHAATSLAVAGSLASLAILLCLQRRFFPAAIKFISSTVDIALVTCLASVGSGPMSPLVVVYFLIIAMAGLRFSLRLKTLKVIP